MIYTPKPHQIIMQDWMSSRPKCALWCAPGLGKTAAVLHRLNDLFCDGTIRAALVISPIRVSRITWPAQIEEWDFSKWIPWHNLNTESGMLAWERGDSAIYLTHYDTLSTREVQTKKGLRRDVGILEKCFHGKKQVPADILVIDESDSLKSHKSKRGRTLRPLTKFFKHRILMTGTPAANGYEDLHPQMLLLDDGERLGRSFHMFKQTYFEKKDWMGFRWELKRGAKEKIDAKLSDICLTLSAEDWLDVPPCSTVDIEISLPAAAMKTYRRMEKEFLAEVEGAEVVSVNAAVKAGKLLQMCSGAVYDEGGEARRLHGEKLAALQKLVGKLKGEPLVVFTQFEHEMLAILSAIKGSVRFSEEAIPVWMKKQIPVLVCHPKSMSHGIDGLQHGGRLVCWMTLPYSPAVYEQANARLVRQGQERETVIHRIIAKDTIDEAVIETLRDKESGQKGLMLALKNLRLLRK